MPLKFSDLGVRSLDLQAARGGVGAGGFGLCFGGVESMSGAIERIPPQPKSLADDCQQAKTRRQRQKPAERIEDAQKGERPHGKAFRSSSKCGPSRRRGQSPPQTTAVPWRAAAALNAAAIRG